MERKFIKFGRILPIITVVVVVGAVFFNYYKGSHSDNGSEKQETKLLPENISTATEGFSIFQFEQGQTIFEIKAKVNLGYKDNKNLLESVTVKIFGKQGNRYDLITSKHCQYDQAKEEIVFLGDVTITLSHLGKLENPNPLSSSSVQLTTVMTEKIKYLQKTRTAETDEVVNFARGRIHGRSRGLTYDFNQEFIYLHSQVEIFVDPVNRADSEIQLKSDTLKYFQTSNQIEMRSHVLIQESFNEIRADVVRAFLNEDSTLTHIDAIGEVQSTSRDPKFLLQVDARYISYFFGRGGRWLDRIVAQGGVQSRSLDPELKRDVSANEMEIVLKPESNLLDTLRASGNVIAVLADGKSVKTKRVASDTPGFQPGDKIIKSPKVLVFFKSDGKQVSRMEAAGPSTLEELPLQPKDDRRILSALALTLFFAKDSNGAERFTANHQVKVDLIPLNGSVKKTTSDHLEALIDHQNRQISQLHQFGNFTYQEGDRLAFSDEAEYSTQDRVVILRGQAQMKDTDSRTTADIIHLHQLQDLVKAQGTVRSVFYNRNKQTKMAMFEPGSPIYASSDFMEAGIQSGIAKYWKKAKLWQEDQVLRAEIIYLYREERRLVAENNVTSLLHLRKHNLSEEKSEEKADRKPAIVQAQRMVYEDQEQKACYEKNVKMNSWMGTVNANQLEIFLDSQGARSSVQRLLATGNVKIHQPNRTSFSDSAEYFRKEERLVLMGGPPRIIDSERGFTSGTRLTMHLDDDSISVEGNSETRSNTRPSVAR